MYKELGLVLVGAACFDLGTVVVPVQAAQADYFLKIGKLAPDHEYLKITMDNVLVSSKSCMANKGTLVEFKGAKYCQSAKTVSEVTITKKK